MRRTGITAVLAIALAMGGAAQSRNRAEQRTGDPCRGGWGDRSSFCEVREETIGVANPLEVDARPNGGIRVRGTDRGDVVVRAAVSGYADTESRARDMVGRVRIDTVGGRIRAEGPAPPSRDRDEYWNVSFDLEVPRRATILLNGQNGGISIADFDGSARFHGKNGGVSLANVNGEIRGETTNGGISVTLRGDHWDGVGLDVETRNGGIRMSVPERYSADLEAGTTNGRIRFDFPITVRGTIDRYLRTTLGSGGAKIRAVTTNGGVTIDRW